jgi:hypothetical protein
VGVAAGLLQLNPPLPVLARTVDGLWSKGWAHVLIDYGIDADLLWVVFFDAGGACWTVRNKDLRAQANWTIGREVG